MNNHTRQKPTVLLLGSYGRGNIGDDIFLLAALELLGERKIYINSSDDSQLPKVVRGRVKTLATEKFDIRKKLSALREIKYIVYWGGDTWVKWYGDKFPRQLLYKMIFINLAARMLGKRVYYVGCGIGRLSGYSLFLARLSAKLANKIIAREKRSADLLAINGVEVFPDLAVNLPFYNKSKHISDKKQFTVGVSLLYYLPEPEVNFPRLLKKIADLLQRLPDNKFKIVLYPMLVTEQVEKDDLWASQQLLSKLPKDKNVEILYPDDLESAVKMLSDIDLLIGTRLHANILGTLSGTPCLGIAYRPKVASFFKDNGLKDYCIDLDSLDKLESVFWHMYNNYDKITKEFYEVSTSNVKQKERYQRFINDSCN